MILFKRDFEKNKLNTTLLCFYPLRNTTSVQPQRLNPTFIIYDMTYIYIYIYMCVCLPFFWPLWYLQCLSAFFKKNK